MRPSRDEGKDSDEDPVIGLDKAEVDDLEVLVNLRGKNDNS